MKSIQVEVFPNNVAVQVQTPAHGTSAGVTVGDFVDALLRLASRNELMASVDYGCGDRTGWIEIERGEDGVEIRECRRG